MNDQEEKERVREKPTIVVSALFRKDGKFLFVRDKKFNFWRPPGGRVNWGETIEETLRREMKEEINSDIEIVKTIGFGEDFAHIQTYDYKTHRLIIYFLCKAKEEIKSYDDNEKESRMKWVDFDELITMKEIEPAFSDMIQRFDLTETLRCFE